MDALNGLSDTRLARFAPRSSSGRRARRAPLLLLAALAGLAAACGERSDVQIARRILEDHRRRARVKPLPGAQVVRLRLSSPARRDGAEGTGRIEWEGPNYRETLSSAGWTIVRGIQAGKAYWTDEDGVTRVASEPVLSELVTRSYFWRRAYLFDDLERARITLGPAEGRTVSVQLTPPGGNPLLLIFSSRGELVGARSPRFDLEFQTPALFTDSSRPDARFQAEIRSTALPSDEMADAQTGGWPSRWKAARAESPLRRAGRALLVQGRIGGLPARIAVDAAADGPLRIRTDFARRLALSPQADVLGRRVTRCGPLEIGEGSSLSYPRLFCEVSDELPDGADALGGSVFFRETVVEVDPAEATVRFHDPGRWTAPPGYFRGLLDDDGDRPVAILRRGSETVRLRAGTAAGPALVLAPESARRLELAAPGTTAQGLHWGTASFPASPVLIEPDAFDPAWGDEGGLGFDLLLNFHVFLDMPRRWAYLQPLAGSP